MKVATGSFTEADLKEMVETGMAVPARQFIPLAYDNLDPSDHVTQTLGAVKAWRAKHPA